MKTLHSYLLVAAALLLTGCAIDRPQEYNPELRLMFQPEMYMHVAHEDVERFPTDETFGVAAWALPEGKTWEEDYVLHNAKNEKDGDLGYPSTVELDDGSLITVYYQKYEDDKKCSMLYTKWQLEEKK